MAGFNLAFLALFDPGDRVAIARPGYPAYRNIMAALGLEVVEIEANAEAGFTLTPDSLERAAARAGKPLKGVLLASPANPTGTVTGKAQLKALADYCRDHSIAFISDEIYHGLTFAGEETTALEVADDAVVINSFSKYYCMTGWRIGWMVLPEARVRAFERIAQSLYISPPELSQIAAEAALGAHEELDGYKRAYAANRALLLERLPQIGFSIASPMDGHFTPMRMSAASPMTAWPSPVGAGRDRRCGNARLRLRSPRRASHHALFLCGRGYRDGGGDEPHRALAGLDHDVFRSGRPKNMNVIDSNSLERDAGGKPHTLFLIPL